MDQENNLFFIPRLNCVDSTIHLIMLILYDFKSRMAYICVCNCVCVVSVFVFVYVFVCVFVRGYATYYLSINGVNYASLPTTDEH